MSLDADPKPLRDQVHEKLLSHLAWGRRVYRTRSAGPDRRAEGA